jgi:hypothetical protein
MGRSQEGEQRDSSIEEEISKGNNFFPTTFGWEVTE